jgi:hypothetical protein
VRLRMRVKGLKPYKEDEEKDGLEAAMELFVERCRKNFENLKTLMD